MYDIRDKESFINQYKSFLKVKDVLYSPITCGYVQRTNLYEELIYSLSNYIDNIEVLERNDVKSIENEFQKFVD